MFEPSFQPSLSESQITFVGLGLMGGSLAMRLRREKACRHLVALLRRPEAIVEAEEQGVVDWATTDPQTALAEADLVIFATPVRILINQLRDYQPFFKQGAVITDLGSTKREILQVMAELDSQVYPIGSHPMCGKEVAGLAVAEATLYEKATWVITPLEDTPDGVIELIGGLAKTIGANPLLLSASRHDQLVAAISHLPYLVSSSLVLAAQTVAEEDDRVWQVAASGFKDTSRIAASDVNMMMDILLTNQDAVADMVVQMQNQLMILSTALAEGDETKLRALLEQARNQRRALYK